jgi:hypothetical protein
MLEKKKISDDMEDIGDLAEENVQSRLQLQMTNRINRFQNGGKLVTKTIKQTQTQKNS